MGRVEDAEVWKSARGHERSSKNTKSSIFHLPFLIKNVWAKAPGALWHPNPGINAVASYPAQPAIRKRSPICEHFPHEQDRCAVICVNLCCNLRGFVDKKPNFAEHALGLLEREIVFFRQQGFDFLTVRGYCERRGLLSIKD